MRPVVLFLALWVVVWVTPLSSTGAEEASASAGQAIGSPGATPGSIGAPDNGLGRYETLTQRNPFVAPSRQKVERPQTPAVTGYFFTGFSNIGALKAMLEHKPTSKSYFLATGESEDGITVQEISVAAREKYVLLMVNGQTVRCNLMPEQVTYAPAGPTVARQPGQPAQPATDTNQGKNSNSGDGNQQGPERRRISVPERSK